jgi:hypothetical protein
MARRRTHPWFWQSNDAFRRSFPEVANDVPLSSFCVCPQCLRAFGEEAWTQEMITREHAPPKSVGGHLVALTCHECNTKRGGAELDNHMRLEADIYDFVKGELAETRAHLRTKSGRVPIQLSVSGGAMKAAVVRGAVDPDSYNRVMQDFQDATIEGKWQDSRINIEFSPHSHARAVTGWLRSAYLAFFATLGYRFIFRPELDIVRAKIREPESELLRRFRVTLPTFSATRRLIDIEAPDEFRSYAMLYRNYAVFLPHYNDNSFYQRLAERDERVEATLSGTEYPWPDGGPTFLHDQRPD